MANPVRMNLDYHAEAKKIGRSRKSILLDITGIGYGHLNLEILEMLANSKKTWKAFKKEIEPRLFLPLRKK